MASPSEEELSAPLHHRTSIALKFIQEYRLPQWDQRLLLRHALPNIPTSRKRALILA